MPRTASFRAVALTAAVTAVAATIAAASGIPAAAAPSGGAVLSEVYGGGGNSGATYNSDFIELANRAATAQDLSGWSVQYLSAGASSTSTWGVTALAGSIAAGDTYLIAEGTPGSTGAALPPGQASGSLNLAAGSGTVALVRSTTALTCKTATDCAADPSVVDLVGYGTAVVREGNPTPALRNTTSAARNSGPDTDDNATDFSAGAPTPTGSTAPVPPQPGPLRIHDIQGDSWLSPQARKAVTNVPGVVTGVRTSGSRGFWIQDPDPDSDPATSEGVFVFTSKAPTVATGDSVLVSGTVSEYYPGSDASVLSVTEIGSPTVTVLSSGNPLPAPVVITPTSVPDTYAPDLGGKNIEATPVTPSRSALDYWESLEGMRVEVDDAPVVGPTNSYGEQYVTTKPQQDRTYRGGAELLGENQTPSGRLEIAAPDGSPAVDVGDTYAGATVGPIDYSEFGGYTLVASTLGTVQKGGLTPIVATPGNAKQLSIATYNVENLAPGDPDAKFARLAQGVVTNLATPDIIAVEEVQDNTGATDDGVVDATTTLQADRRDRHRGRPALRLARDRPGRRQGRRPAGRQHPRGVPLQPGPGDLRRLRLRAASTGRRPRPGGAARTASPP